MTLFNLVCKHMASPPTAPLSLFRWLGCAKRKLSLTKRNALLSGAPERVLVQVTLSFPACAQSLIAAARQAGIQRQDHGVKVVETGGGIAMMQTSVYSLRAQRMLRQQCKDTTMLQAVVTDPRKDASFALGNTGGSRQKYPCSSSVLLGTYHLPNGVVPKNEKRQSNEMKMKMKV